jgi:serine/threonine protein kinase
MPSKAALAAMAANKKAGPEPLPKASKVELLRKASTRVEEEEAQCAVFDKKVSDLVPRFEEGEVKSGKKLGEGGFCSVFEVTALNLGSEGADAHEEKHKSEIEEFHTRKYMSMTCIRKDEARYAVKRLSEKSLGDETLYEKGTADLAFEANFLAVIQHSNIIKVRGFRLGDFCSDGMFIMMDRLYDTLDQAIGKWREQEQKYTSFTGKLKGGKDKSLDLLADRMHFACDLASAFGHLHDMKIIYRDLKPENVGFDIRGDIKIFDFGLAKEVRDPDDEGNYKLTGYCGSPMYMAPEGKHSSAHLQK